MPSIRTSPAPAGAGELSRLLETEERLDVLLQRAHREAEELVAAARRAAAERDAALATELAAAERQQAEAIEAERVRWEALIADAARRAVQRYETIDAPRIATLARRVVERLLEEGRERE